MNLVREFAERKGNIQHSIYKVRSGAVACHRKMLTDDDGIGDRALHSTLRHAFSAETWRPLRDIVQLLSRGSHESIQDTDQLTDCSPSPQRNEFHSSSLPYGAYDTDSDDGEEPWGYFALDNIETETSNVGVTLIQEHHRRSAQRFTHQSNSSFQVEFRAHNPGFIQSTRCFNDNCFAWGIGGFRIVKDRNKYAQYQVIASFDSRIWISWIRASSFSEFSKIAAEKHWIKTQQAWARVLERKMLFRCLDVNYLFQKCRYLEVFLRCALFDADDVNLLLRFAQDPGTYFDKAASLGG